MHHYLTAATLKGAADRRCGDTSDVPTIAPQPRLLLFNAGVIALLAQGCWAASSLRRLMLQHGGNRLETGNVSCRSLAFTT